MTDMTDEQIESFRHVLSLTLIGPYAFFLPREQVQSLRDRMQAHIDSMKPAEHQPQYCSCDQTKHASTIHQDGRVTCNNCQKEREEQ
jgi:hypothetical protein